MNKEFDERDELILQFGSASIFLAEEEEEEEEARTVVSLLDITERKNTEVKLKDSEIRYHDLFENSSEFLYTLDLKGNFTDVNKAAEVLAGYTKSELLKMNFKDYTPKSDHRKLFHALANIYKTGEPLKDFPVEAIMKDKSIKYFETSFSLLKKGDKIIGYHGSSKDITERIRAEKEINMLVHSLKSVNECVSITDTKNRIVFINQSFLTTYGYTEEELIGKHIDIVLSPNNPPESVGEILSTTLQGVWKGKLLNKRKDGSEFPIFLSTTIIHDNAGNILGLIGVAEDITDRERIEKELIAAKEKAEESNMLKSAFLANMSHEIRTPMNGILGFAGLLKEPNLTGDQQQKYIQIIEKSGARMLNIINDIVNISKIESGILDIHLSETNINNQLQFVYDSLKFDADNKKINLSFNCALPEKEAIIKTDSEKFFAILTNLVKNAIKYTDEGTIEFGCEKKGKYLEYFVKDTGIGIPKDRQEAIFERFIQADIEDKMARQGAGLGLAIAKSYVEMFGGKIWVVSEVGKGSTFYFTIPYQTETKEEIAIKNEVLPSIRETQVNRLKILIVEDDETSEILLSKMIDKYSKEILIAKTGIGAIETCRNNHDIDLILMDIQIPEMNGYKATQQIRQFNKDIIIIAQTAFGLSGDREKAIEAGCNDYISKPINKVELQSLIQKYFKK